jgi:hypothetical protein
MSHRNTETSERRQRPKQRPTIQRADTGVVRSLSLFYQQHRYTEIRQAMYLQSLFSQHFAALHVASRKLDTPPQRWHIPPKHERKVSSSTAYQKVKRVNEKKSQKAVQQKLPRLSPRRRSNSELVRAVQCSEPKMMNLKLEPSHRKKVWEGVSELSSRGGVEGG